MISVALFLTLGTLAAAANECPVALTLDEALARTDELPLVRGYADAKKTQAAQAQKISWLHGTTQMQLSPGLRLWPTDQTRPEGAVGLSHQMRLGHLGGARQGVANAEIQVLQSHSDRERVARQLRTAALWVERWSAGAQLLLAVKQKKAAKDLLKRVQDAVSLGALHQTSLLQAEAELVRAKIAQVNAEGRIEESGLLLSEQIGCPTPGAQQIQGAPWPIAENDRVAKEYTESANKQQLAAEKIVEQRRLELIDVEQRPTLGLGWSAEVDGPNTFRSLATLSISWKLFEGDYLARSSHAAHQVLLEAQLAQHTLEELHLMEQLAHEIEHQEANLVLLETELLPRLEKLVTLYGQALALGEGTALDVIRAEMARTKAERQLLGIRTLLALTVAKSRLWAQGVVASSPRSTAANAMPSSFSSTLQPTSGVQP